MAALAITFFVVAVAGLTLAAWLDVERCRWRALALDAKELADEQADLIDALLEVKR